MISKILYIFISLNVEQALHFKVLLNEKVEGIVASFEEKVKSLIEQTLNPLCLF
ncbi:hypothetical protein [Bacillus thuringiensis]|uniref:hypothetical protein n=1 Tax=Bacillus thuringiensis TaxID=1428 RepID=UPI0015C4E8A2|nr:hypothetical protein [Bacillus thuringiensis]